MFQSFFISTGFPLLCIFFVLSFFLESMDESVTQESKEGGNRMQEMRYMISDTAKKIDVEAHVLRYWEEELSLHIARNEMGHRYYTAKDILIFKNIKKLKEQGFALKTIKMVLPEIEKEDLEDIIRRKDELNMQAEHLGATGTHNIVPFESTNVGMPVEQNNLDTVNSQEEKMRQFQVILGNIVAQAIHSQQEGLSKDISDKVTKNVSEKVLKEINSISKEEQERNEEHFRKIDESIRRICDENRKEAEERKQQKVKKKGLFSRKENPKQKQKLYT